MTSCSELLTLLQGTATLELPTKDTAEILGFSAKALQVTGVTQLGKTQVVDPGEWYLVFQ